MKSLFLRSGAALVCALTLASCGGKGGSLALGGTVLNLTRTGLVLQNNGGADYAVPVGTSFTFPTLISYDTAYKVTVKASPSNAVCTAVNNIGTSSTYDINTVVISCDINTHVVGGSVSGLTRTGLTLINGADRISITPLVDNGVAQVRPFTMVVKVAEDAAYGVTVLNQPANQTCAVTGGTGTMAATDVSNIQVTCN